YISRWLSETPASSSIRMSFCGPRPMSVLESRIGYRVPAKGPVVRTSHACKDFQPLNKCTFHILSFSVRATPHTRWSWGTMNAMNLPRFWARGTSGDYICWRWSDASIEDARSQARDAAQKLAERCAVRGPSAAQRYGYGDRPLREPVLREIRDSAGNLAA